jgi:hypothetical protein
MYELASMPEPEVIGIDLFAPPAWVRDALCVEFPDVEWFP